MDRQYPEYPQYDYPRPKTYHSATPSTPVSSAYSSAAITRPAPAALKALRKTRAKRPRGQRTGSRSAKHSIPHNGATCGNSLCDSPHIAGDERLCPGPEDLELCSRCYKRFKVERRRAREAQRAVTDDWRRPKRRHSRIAVEEDRASHEVKSYDEKLVKNYNEKPPSSEYSSGREPAKEPSPLITPLSNLERSEKISGLHNVSTSTLKEHDRRTARSPRKHRSHREKDDQGLERNNHVRDMSTYDEAEFYKYGRVEEDDDYYDGRRCCCSFWSRRRKCVVILSAVLFIIILIITIALAATLSRRKGFTYTPSFRQVNSTTAFDSGGATRKSVNDTDDGIGAGTDSYTYYQGNASNFPAASKWVSFKEMWTANLDTFKNSCGWLNRGPNNTPETIQDIYNAIQDRANASLVDHRIILATIIQETNGCPLNPPTTSSGGTRNPGLMQSHDGHEYDAKHSRLSILQMVQDGTQGTGHGWGLVDNLNTYGNPYKAMRGYNSGYIPESGNLSEKAGATACYVSDIANRLTGWVRAESKCSED